MRKSINEDMIKAAYEYSRKVFHNEIDFTVAVDKINLMTGMDRGSAQAYVHVFQKMMDGTEYKRTLNTAATTYYLVNIKEDYGHEYFVNAISAVKQHTEYYSKQGRGHLRSIEGLVKEFIRV